MKSGRAVPPAYLPLIEQMRFYIEPEVSCSRFFGTACFSERSIGKYRITHEISDLEKTDLGEFIANNMHGGLFIDIPCGRHDAREQDKDFDMTALAAALGVKNYCEVDLMADVIGDRIPQTIDVVANGTYQLVNTLSPHVVRTEHGLNITTMQDDLLGFISKISDVPSAKVLYISAIQPDMTAVSIDVATAYITALYDECARVCTSADLLILNSSAMLVAGIDERDPAMHPALALPPRGFALMRRDAYDKVHVFAKE